MESTEQLHLTYDEFCKQAKCKVGSDEARVAYSHYCLQLNPAFPQNLRFDYIENVKRSNWQDNLKEIFNSKELFEYIKMSMVNLQAYEYTKDLWK